MIKLCIEEWEKKLRISFHPAISFRIIHSWPMRKDIEKGNGMDSNRGSAVLH